MRMVAGWLGAGTPARAGAVGSLEPKEGLTLAKAVQAIVILCLTPRPATSRVSQGRELPSSDPVLRIKLHMTDIAPQSWPARHGGQMWAAKHAAQLAVHKTRLTQLL